MPSGRGIPCSRFKDGDAEMGRGKTHDLFPAALGHRDWGLRTTPPPKWKERRKKEKSRARNDKGRSRNQWWGLTLSLPISPVVCIEHPCTIKQGSWSTSGLPVPLLIWPTSLSGSGGKRWRLISVTLTMAFLLGLLSCLPCPTAFFNIGLQQIRLILGPIF